VVSAGSYILSAALLVVLVLSLGFSAVCIRGRLMPEWEGAPGHLVEAILGVALLIWLSELLGVVGLLYAWTLIAASLALSVAVALASGRRGRAEWSGRSLGFSPGGSSLSSSERGEKQDAAPDRTTPPSPSGTTVVAIAVVAVVFAHWGLTTADALSRGVFNFDSLWYHLPFAVDMAQSHSVTGLHYTETVFTNWFYPQNSELLHSVGILLTHRDTLSLFLNFGWLALAFLAAWCIGRPYGRGPLTVVAAGVLLECHTLVVREPGAAKNDLMAAALLLAAIAILANANWGASERRGWGWPGRVRRPVFRTDQLAREASRKAKNPAPDRATPTLVPLAVAGLATGMAVGTKSTALAMAAALTVAVVFLAPAGRRWAAAGWWFAAALAGGGYWYLRNLVISGNPLPQLEHLGPISLPHPERLQNGRPDFSIAHYATDTAVWRDYFSPELHEAFGLLWPLVTAGAIAGGLIALLWGPTRILRWIGGVALFGMLAYLFTPLSAAGAEGVPVGFGINIRYAIPALLAGITLLPVVFPKWLTSAGPSSAGGAGEGGVRTGESANPPFPRDRTRGQGASSQSATWSWWDWGLLGALLVVLVVTDRPDAVLRDPDRLFAWLVALLLVLVPVALLLAWRRGAPRGAIVAGFGVLVVAAIAIGYPVQRDYLSDRFLNTDPDTSIPGMHLDSAYRWARDVGDARIGLSGTTAGFLEYGFYGADLSNRVRYLGVEGPHGAFNAIQSCAEFRAAVNAADLDYLVTAPFLNFIEPGEPIVSPEARWLRGESAVTRVDRSGPVTVWRVRAPLDPSACGPANAPLRAIPQQPST
jgi:hypothetical protein